MTTTTTKHGFRGHINMKVQSFWRSTIIKPLPVTQEHLATLAYHSTARLKFTCWGFCMAFPYKRLIINIIPILHTYFYGKVNRGHVDCPLYRGGPFLRESIMGGSTVVLCVNMIFNSIPIAWTAQARCSALNCPLKEFPSRYYTDCVVVSQSRNQFSEGLQRIDNMHSNCLKFFNFGFKGQSFTSAINICHFQLDIKELQTFTLHCLQNERGWRHSLMWHTWRYSKMGSSLPLGPQVKKFLNRNCVGMTARYAVM